MFKKFLCAIVVLCPHVVKIWVYRHILGYKVGPEVHIGFSYICVESMELRKGASIGAFNVFRDVPSVHMGEYASIGSWNWFTSIKNRSAFKNNHLTRAPSLLIGNHAAITSRHYFDIQDRVELLDFSTFAGVRSQVFTHGIDVESNAQLTAPVVIGEYTYIGSGVIVLPGGEVPRASVIGAGSLVNRKYTDEYSLYAGVPAVKRKEFNRAGFYFTRTRGGVD